jgi:hypothetical protein
MRRGDPYTGEHPKINSQNPKRSPAARRENGLPIHGSHNKPPPTNELITKLRETTAAGTLARSLH